jgi:hypothetical protein
MNKNKNKNTAAKKNHFLKSKIANYLFLGLHIYLFTVTALRREHPARVVDPDPMDLH